MKLFTACVLALASIGLAALWLVGQPGKAVGVDAHSPELVAVRAEIEEVPSSMTRSVNSEREALGGGDVMPTEATVRRSGVLFIFIGDDRPASNRSWTFVDQEGAVWKKRSGDDGFVELRKGVWNLKSCEEGIGLAGQPKMDIRDGLPVTCWVAQMFPLSGNVVDALGLPLEGVRVQLDVQDSVAAAGRDQHSSSSITTISNSVGEFSFVSKVANSSSRLLTSKSGYYPMQVQVPPSRDGTHTVSIQMQSLDVGAAWMLRCKTVGFRPAASIKALVDLQSVDWMDVAPVVAGTGDSLGVIKLDEWSLHSNWISFSGENVFPCRVNPSEIIVDEKREFELYVPAPIPGVMRTTLGPGAMVEVSVRAEGERKPGVATALTRSFVAITEGDGSLHFDLPSDSQPRVALRYDNMGAWEGEIRVEDRPWDKTVELDSLSERNLTLDPRGGEIAFIRVRTPELVGVLDVQVMERLGLALIGFSVPADATTFQVYSTSGNLVNLTPSASASWEGVVVEFAPQVNATIAIVGRDGSPLRDVSLSLKRVAGQSKMHQGDDGWTRFWPNVFDAKLGPDGRARLQIPEGTYRARILPVPHKYGIVRQCQPVSPSGGIIDVVSGQEYVLKAPRLRSLGVSLETGPGMKPLKHWTLELLGSSYKNTYQGQYVNLWVPEDACVLQVRGGGGMGIGEVNVPAGTERYECTIQMQ